MFFHRPLQFINCRLPQNNARESYAHYTTDPSMWQPGFKTAFHTYGDQRWLHTLSRDNWRPICSTPDVLANRRNIHHHPALLWRYRDSGTGYKTANLLTVTAKALPHGSRLVNIHRWDIAKPVVCECSPEQTEHEPYTQNMPVNKIRRWLESLHYDVLSQLQTTALTRWNKLAAVPDKTFCAECKASRNDFDISFL